VCNVFDVVFHLGVVTVDVHFSTELSGILGSKFTRTFNQLFFNLIKLPLQLVSMSRYGLTKKNRMS